MSTVLRPDGKALVVAMDHARTHGVIEGLENPGKVIDTVIDAGADAIMTSYGVIKHYRDRLIGRIPTLMRLDGGPSLYREDWLAYTEWKLLHTVEDALMLGVDGVCLMAFVGIPVELETFKIVADVSREAMKCSLPVMVEALPGESPRIPDAKDAGAMASAARLGFEHGADIIKTYYTGSTESFRKVIDNCPVPTLIAGGAKMDTTEETLEVVYGAMQAGCKGVVFGRNIWQNPHPHNMVTALKMIIHDDATVAEAMEAFA
ncbi:MAG: fructose-bisphosphate aldolase [Caldilineaceae bacterium]|nr:fructose-bisphosphate aldolase [Caldilineaceae bacterium]MCB9139124.1 fructose-bisphosphate aldolase [Caldilineaceae bacterium]